MGKETQLRDVSRKFAAQYKYFYLHARSTHGLNTYITKRYRYSVSAARCSIRDGLKFRRKGHKSSARLSREISNAAINCRSKRVKRSGREIKSDARSGLAYRPRRAKTEPP